jgi:tetratricopeptide (TPR) repeat protein
MRIPVALATFVLAVAAAPAWAQEPSAGAVQPPPAEAAGAGASSTSARSAFDAGRALFDAGRYAEALPLLQQAYVASRSPNAHLLIARCLRETGKLAEAYEEMSATSREASARAESDPRYVPTRDAAAAELVLLERRVGRLVVALEDVLSEWSVNLDGVPLPAERRGVVVAVSAGVHVVDAQRAKDPPARQEVTVAAGEMKTLALKASAPAFRVVVYQPSGGAVRTVGYAALGLGAAGLILFAVAGGIALSNYDSLQHDCAVLASCADDSHHGLIDTGKTLQTVANIGLAFGAPALVTGGLMAIFGGPRKPTPSLFAGQVVPGAAVSPGPGGGLRLGATLSF